MIVPVNWARVGGDGSTAFDELDSLLLTGVEALRVRVVFDSFVCGASFVGDVVGLVSFMVAVAVAAVVAVVVCSFAFLSSASLQSCNNFFQLAQLVSTMIASFSAFTWHCRNNFSYSGTSSRRWAAFLLS